MSLATLNDWTPKRAANFCRRRIKRIEQALIEIGACYGDVDNSVVMEADNLRWEGLSELKELIDQAEKEGRTL